MTRLSCYILALAALLQHVHAQDGETGETCSLYLAETLDDNGRSTMGVFSGRDLPPGSLVGLPDVVVPLVDIPMHNSPTQEIDEHQWSVWGDFVWDSLDAGGLNEGVNVMAAVLGLGSLTRGDSEMANAMLIQSHCDNSGLHRSRDPGAGATSYYHGASLVATETISAGSEILFPEGFHWYLDPEEPLNDPQVQEILQRYKDTNAMDERELTDEVKTKIWSLLQKSSTLDESVKTALPESWSRVANNGGDHKAHSPEWLKENGLCIDTLTEGPSTIPQAGHGAFAKRAVKEGSIIAPAPLVHVLDRKALNMYEVDTHDDSMIKEKVVGTQLLLNYCFGHQKSEKLLCPIGAGTSFINHSPKPNAAIRWSTHPSSALHRQEWLDLSLEELTEKADVALMVEYVALRDIEPGEEIFIHYGADWEKAWEEHVQNWSPLPGSKDYVSANDMNEDRVHDVIRTIEEQKTNPYPMSVVTSCYYEYDPEEEEGFLDDSGEYTNSREQEAVIKDWTGMRDEVPDYMFLRPCVVLDRYDIDDDDDAPEEAIDHDYTVQILNYDHMREDQKVPDEEFLVVEGVPRDAIAFTASLYSADMHLKNAFRHEMMMDEALFPKHWRKPST